MFVFKMTWLMGILRICLDKLLRDEAFNVAKIPKCYGYQRSLTSMIYDFFDKRSTFGDGATNKNMSNENLAKELQKPIIRNLKINTTFIDSRQYSRVLIFLIWN